MLDTHRLLNTLIETGVAATPLAERMDGLPMGGLAAGGLGTFFSGLADGVGNEGYRHPARRLIDTALGSEQVGDSATAATSKPVCGDGGAHATTDDDATGFHPFDDLGAAKTYLEHLSRRLFGDDLRETGGLTLLRRLAASVLAASPGEPNSTPTPGEAVEALWLEDPEQSGTRAMLMVRTMLAAAKAGGTLTPDDRHRIREKLDTAGLSAEERMFAERVLDKPLDVGSIVDDIADRLTAAEVYTASLLALDLKSPLECAYIADLGSRLGISIAGDLH